MKESETKYEIIILKNWSQTWPILILADKRSQIRSKLKNMNGHILNV